MVLEQPATENRAMTLGEASMERSKSFVKALQELKSLRPQLYSAAEYCEKSYILGENKQMVLDNLKDYAVRAIVNAVDHIGTVAYKLSDVLEQPSLDIRVMELKITVLNQKFLTCQTLTDKEGLRQQQLLASNPRHHKHYTLPNAVNRKVCFGPQTLTDPGKNLKVRSRLQQSGTNSAKSLSWHLASEAKSSSKGKKHSLTGLEASGKMQVFQLLHDEDNVRLSRSLAPPNFHNRVSSSSGSIGTAQWYDAHKRSASSQDSVDLPRPLTILRSFDSPNKAIIRPPVHSKSLLSLFFAKPKTPKLRAGLS